MTNFEKLCWCFVYICLYISPGWCFCNPFLFVFTLNFVIHNYLLSIVDVRGCECIYDFSVFFPAMILFNFTEISFRLILVHHNGCKNL